MARLVEHVEETIEANGRTPVGGGVESPHCHILHLSNMVIRSARHLSGARFAGPRPGRPTPHQCAAADELENADLVSRGSLKKIVFAAQKITETLTPAC